MKKKLNKVKTKNKIKKDILLKKPKNIFEKFSYYFFYIKRYPQAIIKAPIFLITKGPKFFIKKLIRIENVVSKVKKNNKTTELHFINRIINFFCIFFSFLKRIAVFVIYPFIVFIFFLIFKIFHSLIYIFAQNLKTEKDSLNGISFIIPTWNKKDLVVKCVKELDKIAFSEKSNIPKEIIVIDNGSIDDTFEALSRIKTKISLKIIRSKINLGFAKGINLGALKAKYNYIYLLNNDMIPKTGMIKEIVNFAEKLLKTNRPFFGLSSQIFFFDPKKRREESGKTYYKSDFGYLYVAHCVNNYNLTQPSITAYPGGGASLINKNLFIKLGGYDHNLYRPLYCEDLDLGFIAWKLGFPSYFVPKSQIIHHHRSSSKKLIKDPNYFMFKNWLTFILKNYDSYRLILSHLFFYSFRMLADSRFVDYAWENIKLMPRIFYKKILLSKYKRIYKDYELINFPKFEFKFETDYEK